MGRKKKTEETPQVTNTKELEVSSSTPISYKGTVQIKIKKGNKIISNTTKRNKGANEMFLYLAYCLYGELKDILAPDYIVLAKKPDVENNETLHTILSNVVKRTSSELAETYSIASKKFLIPYGAIISTSNVNCDEIILLNANKKDRFSTTAEITDAFLEANACAIIELTEGNVINIQDFGIDDSVIIVWSMQIINAAE